jgi:chromate transporter
MPNMERTRSRTEVLLVFLRLGCTSFGGPAAHLGYFRSEFVERRRWCAEETFAEIIALAQSLPGPASSQVGFAIGLMRAGWGGGLAAWVGFTLPSAILMLAFASAQESIRGRVATSILHGLQLVAVAIVAQAVVSMRKTLAPDRRRMCVALLAAAIVLFCPASIGTPLAIASGAICGRLFLDDNGISELPTLPIRISKMAGALAGVLFLALLVLSSLPGRSQEPGIVSVGSAFYRSGVLVFGGGHLVLPLLERAVVTKGWADQQNFLSGYGAAQALPGPLFALAAFLGAVIRPSAQPLLMGALALLAIFLPGLLVMVAVFPFWATLRRARALQSGLRGANASVIGILIAAFIRPVASSAVHNGFDLSIALAAFLLLTIGKSPPWVVVALTAAGSVLVNVAVK